MVLFMLLVPTNAVAEKQETYTEVDWQMIEQLALNQEQALAYLAIMRKQREAFFALKSRNWPQQLALYQETFAMLKPVLNDKQHAEFVAIINSVIEDVEVQDFLVTEEQSQSIAVSEEYSH